MVEGTTRVWLAHVGTRLNIWLRFGRPLEVRNVDVFRRTALFVPGEVFGRVWWSANEHGTVEWTFAVLRAVHPSQGMLRIRGIEPGAQILMRVTTPDRVKVALRVVDQIEACPVHPSDVSPNYWRMVGARLAIRDEPPPYSLAVHRAYIARAALR